MSHIVPVKRKDLFKLLGLNETSDIVDPSEEADAKKVALQNFLCSSDKDQFNIHDLQSHPRLLLGTSKFPWE